MEAEQEPDVLFSWSGLRFEQVSDYAYAVYVECTVLVDGADPRELNQKVLNEAFSVREEDCASFTWVCDVEILNRLTRVGDVFQVKAVVEIGSNGDIETRYQVISMAVKSLTDQVQTIQGLIAEVDAGSSSDSLIKGAGAVLTGLCLGLGSQLATMQRFLAVKKVR